MVGKESKKKLNLKMAWSALPHNNGETLKVHIKIVMGVAQEWVRSDGAQWDICGQVADSRRGSAEDGHHRLHLPGMNNSPVLPEAEL